MVKDLDGDMALNEPEYSRGQHCIRTNFTGSLPITTTDTIAEGKITVFGIFLCPVSTVKSGIRPNTGLTAAVFGEFFGADTKG